MTNSDAETIIVLEFLREECESLLSKMENRAAFDREIKYNLVHLNRLFGEVITNVQKIIQKVVDSFYTRYYEVKGFVPFKECDSDYAIETNRDTLNSMIKLIKFVEK